MVSEGVCSSNAVILKQIAELTANCKSAASHHAHPGAHHHEHGHHEHQSFMLSLAHPWHHFLKEFSELITVVFHTLAVLTVAAGGVTAFFIAAELGIKWLICQVKALAGDQDAIKKAKDETKKHDRQLNKLRHKLCGSIALGLNFLLAAEVTEQLAADHKETALEAVTEALGFLVMVVVRAVIGYEANKEQEEAKEALEHAMEHLLVEERQQLQSMMSFAPALLGSARNLHGGAHHASNRSLTSHITRTPSSSSALNKVKSAVHFIQHAKHSLAKPTTPID